MRVPEGLAWMREVDGAREWLDALPDAIERATAHWGLTIGEPWDGHVSFAAPVRRADGSPAGLKIIWQHRETEHEPEALAMWNGNGAVRLLDRDGDALLLERCDPGTPLSLLAAESPDAALDVIVDLLPRLWIDADEPFTSLAGEAERWAANLPHLWERTGRTFDRGLVDAGVEYMTGLPASADANDRVLLHQDLHGDNVLAAAREPWLVIDPKPLVGERAFGLAPIIRSGELGEGDAAVVHRFRRLTTDLGLDRERVRGWAVAQTLAWSMSDDGTGIHPRMIEIASLLLRA